MLAAQNIGISSHTRRHISAVAEVMALGPVTADARPVSKTPGRDGERLHLGLHLADVLIPPRRLLLQRPETTSSRRTSTWTFFEGGANRPSGSSPVSIS